MKEEIRWSNCDKGVEKWNYREKESKKREKEKLGVKHDAARGHCGAHFDTLRDIQGGQAG